MKTSNNNKMIYTAPFMEVTTTELESVFCASGDHEGITVVDW